MRVGEFTGPFFFGHYLRIRNMDSVISQQQLGMLLSSMQDSVPKRSVLDALAKSAKLDPYEKNMVYHRILETIKSQDPKTAAGTILELLQGTVSEKLNAVAQTIDQSYGDNSTADGKPTTGVGSPIFRRVG